MNKKLILTVTVWLVSLLMATSLVYVLATGSMSNPTFEAGTQVETAAYIFWREGSTYYVKNGSTGEVASGANFTALMEDYVDEGATCVLLGGARFEFDGRIFLSSNMTIQGFNNPVLTPMGSGSISTRMVFTNINYVSGDDENILIEGCTFAVAAGARNNLLYFGNVENLMVQNNVFIGLDGTNTAQLSLNYTLNARILNNVFEDAMGSQQEAMALEDHCNGTVISGNHFENIGREGIYIGNSNWHLSINENSFLNVSECINFKENTAFSTANNNIFMNCDYAVLMDALTGQSYSNSFTGNTIQGMTYYGFRFRDCSKLTVSGNTIVDTVEGVGLAANCYDVSITGNEFSDCQIAIYIYEGVNVTCSGNIITDGKAGQSYGIRIGEPIGAHNASWCVFTSEMIRNVRYGIFENVTGTSTDYNIVVGCIVRDCSTLNIYITGTNSKANLCYNGTTWIS